MNRLSKRLKTLASFIDINDSLVDVGCDHGYFSIYLFKNKLCKNVICSDINNNALNVAINNIKKENIEIGTYLSDGIKDVPMEGINTLVISGMGTSTIIEILDNKDILININKIVLQSNNNQEELRRYMNEIGYYLEKEIPVYDRGKWYLCMLYYKSNKRNDDNVLKYGYLNNKEYVEYLLNKYKKILERIPQENTDYNYYKKAYDDIKLLFSK